MENLRSVRGLDADGDVVQRENVARLRASSGAIDVAARRRIAAGSAAPPSSRRDAWCAGTVSQRSINGRFASR